MNNYRYDPQTGEPIYQPPVKEIYSSMEVLFAWFSLLVGYAFCRVFPVIYHPFGGLLIILVLYVGAVVLWKWKGAKLPLMPGILGGSALLLTPALFLSSNSTIHFFVYLYALVTWFYLIYGLCGNLLENGFSDLLLFDFLKALLLYPLTSLGKMIPALFSGKGRGKSLFLKILLGLTIAVVPTVMALVLLSYDQAFVSLFRRVFSFDWGSFFSHIGSVILGIPVGMYFYGLFFSAHRQKGGEKLTAERCRSISAAVKMLPGMTAIASSVPILSVYLLFFISQWNYYTSAFTGVLPAEFSFAEYARSGFFQLCAVSVLNLVMIIMIGVFVRRKGETATVTTRVLSLIFSGATLVLIATAFSKLYLYVKQFGLTPKRVYAGWFMVILTVVFLLVIVKQLAKRFKLLPTAALVCVGLFTVLALSGSDTLIANYNVDRYLDGSLETVDIDAMRDLGDAAVPAMVRLGEKLASKNGYKLSRFEYEGAEETYVRVVEYLYGMAERDRDGLFDLTLPKVLAKKSLSKAGIRNLNEGR